MATYYFAALNYRPRADKCDNTPLALAYFGSGRIETLGRISFDMAPGWRERVLHGDMMLLEAALHELTEMPARVAMEGILEVANMPGHWIQVVSSGLADYHDLPVPELSDWALSR